MGAGGRIQLPKPRVTINNFLLNNNWRRLRSRRLAALRIKSFCDMKVEEITDEMETITDVRSLRMAQVADTIFSKGTEFVTSATNISYIPRGNPAMPEVAFMGRSKVGKTALMRALFKNGKTVAPANSKRRAQCINYFCVGGVLSIADCPGYGTPYVGVNTVIEHAALIRNFVRFRPSLKMLYYCIDINYRRGLIVQDIDVLKFLSKEVPNFTIVVTKADSLVPHTGRSGRTTESGGTHKFSAQDVQEELLRNGIEHPVVFTSAYRQLGVDSLRFDIVSNCLHAIPTEALSYTEALRLSRRLLTAEEMSLLNRPGADPDYVDEQLQDWRFALAAEEAAREAGTEPGEAISSTVIARRAEEMKNQERAETQSENAKSLQKKLSNESHLNYIAFTSPWRNPLLWPKHVIPTGSSNVNVMRSAEDPTNPYLTQARFVAPRMDMVFRRPNLTVSRTMTDEGDLVDAKGMYKRHVSLGGGRSMFTIPWFPDIVDVDLVPAAQSFSRRNDYYMNVEEKNLAIASKGAFETQRINPLLDIPAPHDRDLMHEVQILEKERYTSPVRFLTPK